MKIAFSVFLWFASNLVGAVPTVAQNQADSIAREPRFVCGVSVFPFTGSPAGYGPGVGALGRFLIGNKFWLNGGAIVGSTFKLQKPFESGYIYHDAKFVGIDVFVTKFFGKHFFLTGGLSWQYVDSYFKQYSRGGVQSNTRRETVERGFLFSRHSLGASAPLGRRLVFEFEPTVYVSAPFAVDGGTAIMFTLNLNLMYRFGR